MRRIVLFSNLNSLVNFLTPRAVAAYLALREEVVHTVLPNPIIPIAALMRLEEWNDEDEPVKENIKSAFRSFK